MARGTRSLRHSSRKITPDSTSPRLFNCATIFRNDPSTVATDTGGSRGYKFSGQLQKSRIRHDLGGCGFCHVICRVTLGWELRHLSFQ